MRDYVIMTDSCCDLPSQYIEEKNIPYVSLVFNFQGKEYQDNFGKSLSYKAFYDGVRQGDLPKTSQQSPEAYYRMYRELIEQGKDILYICVSSGISGTFNSANIAKAMVLEEYKDARIEIVDTLTASLGQGLMVMKAVEMKESGAGLEEIISYMEENKLNLNTYLTVNDLIHLKRGGRISSTAALIGMVLHFKPILTFNDEGKAIPVFKVKGRKNSLAKLADIISERIEKPREQIIAICHGDALLEAEKLKELILKLVKVKNVVINFVGPVVGTHGGPEALAVFFFGKHRQNHIIDVNI